MRTMPWIPTLLLTLAPLLANSALAQNFSESLTEEELVATGLDSLSLEQIEALNALVESYKAGALRRPENQAEPAIEPEPLPPQVPERSSIAATPGQDNLMGIEQLDREPPKEAPKRIKSRLIGTFRGWDGNTVFRLENGQVWRQRIEDVVKYRPSENPEVTVYRSLGGYRIKVEGYRQSCAVKRIK